MIFIPAFCFVASEKKAGKRSFGYLIRTNIIAKASRDDFSSLFLFIASEKKAGKRSFGNLFAFIFKAPSARELARRSRD